MSKVNPIQTDFTAGEVSLKCMGRVDLARYAHAAEIMENFMISPQGGAVRRSGTRYVATAPVPANFTRIYSFRFSVTDAVIVEFSNLLIRFYKNQGIVLNGGTPYSVTSPYLSTDLPNLKFTQSASILYAFNSSYPTQLLSRFGDTNWTIAPMALVDGPYLDNAYISGITQAATGTTLTSTATSAGSTGTVTASTSIFASTDVGRHIRIYNGTNSSASTQVGWLTITAYTSGTVVSVTAVTSVPNGANTLWNLGAISATTGYPAVGSFFQQRLVLANTPGQPQTFWMSQPGDFYNFGPSLFDTTVTDSCGIAYTIASSEVNDILWFSPSSVLMMGTGGAEWQINSNSYNASPVTPTNIVVALQTSNGGLATPRALRVGWETLFIARTGRDIFKLVYEFQINGFQAKSLSLLGEHIAREGNQLFDVAYQQFPYSVLWFPRSSDGRIAGLTYLAEQDVVGWHRHTLGGMFGTGNAVVESLAVIPTPDGTKDQLWMVVKRTIGGSTTRYIEFMEIPYDQSDTPQNNACFLDSATTYNGAQATVLSGFNYLIGETVSIIADGSEVPDQVVSPSGTITLAVPASLVTVGYSFSSILKMMRIEQGGSAGTAQGKTKRVHRVVSRVYETLGMEWSIDGENWNMVEFRDASDPAGSAPPLKTDDIRIPIDMPYDYDGQIWFRQMQPYPMTMLALMPEEMVNQ